MKKIVVVAIVVLVVAGILVAFFARKPGVDVRLIYAARSWGYLVPIREATGGRWLGGFERRSTAIKRATESAAGLTFVVDAGGFFADRKLGTIDYQNALATYTLKGLELTGVEVMNVGLIDQMQGREALENFASQVSFPFISASLVDPETNEYVFPPYTIIKKQGLRIAFAGILDPEDIMRGEVIQIEAEKKTPATKEMPVVTGMPTPGEGLRVLSLREAFSRLVPLLETAGADTVVLLACGGDKIWQALYPYRDNDLFHVGLGVSGRPSKNIIRQGQILLFLNGNAGTHVGIVDARRVGPTALKHPEWQAVALDKTVPKDPTLASLVTEMRKSLASIDPDLLIERIYEPSGKERYTGAKQCAQCHRNEYEIWAKGPHAAAYNSLADINAQFDPKCLLCHTSDYQAIDGFVSTGKTPHMQPINCEVCHGRGSLHVEANLAGEKDKARLRIPDPPRCTKCHMDEIEPDYHKMDFDYSTYWPKIRHGGKRQPEPPQPADPAKPAE